MYCEGTADILDAHGCGVDTHVFIYTHTPSAADSLRPRDGTQCIHAARGTMKKGHQRLSGLFDGRLRSLCGER